MNKQVSASCISYRIIFALILIVISLSPGYCQPSAPPKNIAAFFHEIIGEWIGTVDQYTGDVKADTKYFHAVIKQTSSDTYKAEFEYYRLDLITHTPLKVGTTSMTNKITAEGIATNTISGKGEVLIDVNTSKPEEHTLSEVLHMAPSGSLIGEGSGSINISGITLGAGKNGKVSDYTSTWKLKDGVLSISEQLTVSFKILFFSKHYDIKDEFKAKRGSDIAGLMKNAGDKLNLLGAAPNH